MGKSVESGAGKHENISNLTPNTLAQILMASSQKLLVDNPTPESTGTPNISEKVYPLGCFSAQVHFAYRWAKVTDTKFSDALLRKTALYRTITGDVLKPEDTPPDVVSEALENIYTAHGIDGLTRTLYTVYAQQSHSNYHPNHRFGAFDYDYNATDAVVKVHFENPRRGENPLSPEKLIQRKEDLKNMFANIQTVHPEARTVVSASWIRSTRSYQELFPPDVYQSTDLMSSDMNFGGDSVWGQFIDRNGNVNLRVYDQFLQSLSNAQNTNDLVNSFPFRVLRIEDPIEKYYDFYDVSQANA